MGPLGRLSSWGPRGVFGREPISEPNGWVGEQAYSRGDGSMSREGRKLNRRKNGEDSSGWGRSDGHAIKHRNIARLSTYN